MEIIASFALWLLSWVWIAAPIEVMSPASVLTSTFAGIWIGDAIQSTSNGGVAANRGSVRGDDCLTHALSGGVKEGSKVAGHGGRVSARNIDARGIPSALDDSNNHAMFEIG